MVKVVLPTKQAISHNFRRTDFFFVHTTKGPAVWRPKKDPEKHATWGKPVDRHSALARSQQSAADSLPPKPIVS